MFIYKMIAVEILTGADVIKLIVIIDFTWY